MCLCFVLGPHLSLLRAYSCVLCNGFTPVGLMGLFEVLVIEPVSAMLYTKQESYMLFYLSDHVFFKIVFNVDK